MPLVDLSGTLSGSGGVAGGVGIITGIGQTLNGLGGVSPTPGNYIDLPTTLSGSSSFVGGDPQRILMFTGNLVGAGALNDGLLINLSATFSGSGDLQGALNRIVGVSAYLSGGGGFALSIPEPFAGFGLLTAFMDVVHIRAPYCPPPALVEFRWLQEFQRGDLEICITDVLCSPIIPYAVTYTLYQVVHGCQLHQVGCSKRVPARSGEDPSHFYVTGTAGEGGQPGVWIVRWCIQKSFGGPILEKDTCFRVVDSVLRPLPGDTTQRTCKYGWF